MSQSEHYSVLLAESVSALIGDKDGIYFDGTFGRGGHSRAVLSALGQHGQLIGFDKDLDAIKVGQELKTEDPRFDIEHCSFADMKEVASKRDVEGKVDGVLLDLGVSSPQLDNAERGFSFMNDGPLDMRMDTSKGISAAEWVNTTEVGEMIRVFREYGEERFAKRIASAIVKERAVRPFERTLHLSKVVAEANPRWEKDKNPATRVFQAIRICINRELDDLISVLPSAMASLKPGGRLVVISFHSLEDRIVKRFMRDAARGELYPSRLPIPEEKLNKTVKLIGKAQRADKSEVDENRRSRSAVLRVAEKLGGRDEKDGAASW